ncbi:MAG TPA: HAMP domain-containing protein, partial [Thermoanaerobaculia bacterium]|nr:HAMP domain-containing protein [Thermoanaerobaculia bacterium]
MSLRLRLFLLLAGLVALLVAAQGWLVRTLATRLDRDLGTVATRFGQDLLSSYEFRTWTGAVEASPDAHLVVIGEPGGAAAAGGGDKPAASEPGGGRRWVVQEEWVEPSAEDGVLERRIDVRVLRPGAPPPASAESVRPVLEPTGEGAVVFHRGPLGARRLEVPKGPVASTLDRFGSELLTGSLALLGLGLVGAAVLAHRATRPLAELAAAAERVGSGELGVAVPVARRDEVGAAIASFNAMSARLAELDRENRRLAESQRLAELGEVARGLAHTLRNPLNALGLSLDALAAGAGGEAAAELAETSRRQIRRIDGALRGFLALASSGTASAEPVELGALAREVALEALQDGPGRCRIRVEAAEPVPLVGIEAEIKAILQALVVNACEASAEGGEVVVQVAGEGEEARISVEDAGAGLPPAI